MNKNKQYIKDDYITLILLVMTIGIFCINFDFFLMKIILMYHKYNHILKLRLLDIFLL